MEDGTLKQGRERAVWKCSFGADWWPLTHFSKISEIVKYLLYGAPCRGSDSVPGSFPDPSHLSLPFTSCHSLLSYLDKGMKRPKECLKKKKKTWNMLQDWPLLLKGRKHYLIRQLNEASQISDISNLSLYCNFLSWSTVVFGQLSAHI